MILSYIIPFLALILIVVFIHEYGHYYFAKRFGVGVTDFSIGFGKELFGKTSKGKELHFILKRLNESSDLKYCSNPRSKTAVIHPCIKRCV